MNDWHWVLIGGFAVAAVICLQPQGFWKAITTEFRNWKLTPRRRFFGRE